MAEPGSAAVAMTRGWASESEPRSPRRDVERARDGDALAFDRILQARLEPAFRTALAILGREDEARDACQEAFVATWRELPRLKDVDRFDAWFGRILVNACRDALRAGRRRSVREIAVDEAATSSLRSDARPLDDQLGDVDALERAFARLSLAERTILTLHHLEHRSVAEIGAVLAIPEGTVKSRLHAARRSFERAWR